jgi:hypothetical protein
MYALLIASVIARPRGASFLFVMVATLFQKLCSNLDGSIYFFLAAFCDFAVVGILYRFGTSRKSLDMMLISIVSMLINLMGWFLWFFYRPLDIYAATFTMLEVLRFISTTLAIVLMLVRVVEWYIEARKRYELYWKHTSRNGSGERDDDNGTDD